ncbi:MAG: AAA family ATPase [Vulcanimicrobiaceae bacterium]
MPLPRLAPGTIERQRIATWFLRNADAPLRFLVAPPGSGKTSAIVTHLRNATRPYAYVNATPQLTLRDVCKEIAEMLDLPAPRSLDALLKAIAADGPVDLAIDNIDVLAPEIVTALAGLVEEAPERVTLIYASQSRDPVELNRLVPQGLAVVCDARMLAFDQPEIARVADGLGVAYVTQDLQRFHEETEGWSIVVAGAIRDAAANGRSLCNAYAKWVESQSTFFKQFIESSIASLNGVSPDLWNRLMATGLLENESDLVLLERRGAFVFRDGELGLRPYRVVANLMESRPTPAAAPVIDHVPMIVRMFGSFDAKIGNRSIKWVRRRDQQIVKYLLLKEDGKASRTELCQVFWPEIEPQLAFANLRVACSNIRKAIGLIVGPGHVDRYFTSDGDIAVSFSNITVDARRFRLHVSDGDKQYQLGNVNESLAHYRAADSLYTGRLGWSDGTEDWIETNAALYESLYHILLRRIEQIYREKGDTMRTVEYATKASSVYDELNSPARSATRVS